MSAFETILVLTVALIGFRIYYTSKQAARLSKELYMEKDDREAEKDEAFLELLRKGAEEARKRRERAEEHYSKLGSDSEPPKQS